MMRRLALWWHAVRSRRRFESDLDAEFEFHLHARTDDLIAQGVAPDQARRRAQVELGMQGMHRDACRQARGLVVLDHALRDLRYAVRGLWRNPGYSITALLVLGIALGANALLFALFSAYGLRAPPLADASRWVSLEAITARDERMTSWPVAEADALVARPSAGIDVIYAMREVRLVVEPALARLVGGESVSDNYFDALGVTPALGRAFTAQSDAGAELVLSDLGWQRLLAGEPNPLGRTLTVAGRAFTVVGVMPPAFSGTTPQHAMYWLRERDYRAIQPRADGDGLALLLGGMRSHDSSLAQASAALSSRAVAANSERDAALRVARAEVSARRGYLAQSDMHDLVQACLPIAFAFVLLLLVAAANLANLVLARFASRQGELAIRVAVGAPRRRLISQLLTECGLLASMAAVLGFALASALLLPLQAFLFSLLGEFGIDLIALRIDLGVLVYTWVLALLATVAFGLIPALLATAAWRGGRSRPDLTAMQRASGSRMRSLLMVTQLAISVMLLVIAGLVAMNARGVAQIRIGFDPARTIAVHPGQVTPALARELAALPQVERIALTSRAPLMGTPHRIDALVGARSEPLFVRAVDAAYFEVFGIDILHGRGFLAADEAGANVVLVSRRTAEHLWPGVNPIGQVIDLPAQERLGRLRGGQFVVVGVVADVVSAWFVSGIDGSAVYLPTRVGDPAVSGLMLRTRDTSVATLDAIARACTRVDPQLSCELMPMLLAVRIQRLPFLAASTLSMLLGWIALGISCIGLYGLVSYLVVQKRAEIGVRLALGASHARVIRHLLSGAARQIGIGVAIGIPLAFAVARVLAALSDKLHTFDMVSFVVVPLLLALLALLAAWLPARRCARILPSEALRQN